MPEAFARLTRPLPEPHLLVTDRGTILACNPAAARALALDSPPPRGLRLDEVGAGPPERLERYLRLCASSGDILPGAIEVRTNGGTPVRYRCEGAAVEPPTGEGGARILLRFRPQEDASHRFLLLNEKIAQLGREIHERSRVEEELQAQAIQMEENAAELELMVEELERQRTEAQDANRAKSEFLAVMSHELRTPLNAVAGYADLLDAEVNGPLNDEQRTQVGRIRRAAQHLIAIIEQILEFARLEAGRDDVLLEEVDLAEVAREAAELMEPAARARGLELRVELPDRPLTVPTDAAKVRQILLNLLANAVKFTSAGHVRLRASDAPPFACVEVADTGTGIAPADLERIFEPFWQAERGTTRTAGGTGLGLTVTRRLARLLGGDVTARSAPGEGAVFTLLLPRGPHP